MPIGKVWIYRLLFVCFFVRLRISPLGIKLAASNFARPFIGVQARESPIFMNFAPPEADSSDFGLLGSNVPQNRRFLAQDAHEPSCKI